MSKEKRRINPATIVIALACFGFAGWELASPYLGYAETDWVIFGIAIAAGVAYLLIKSSTSS